jgi:RNA polymerase sigma factor (sigma-70 family)
LDYHRLLVEHLALVEKLVRFVARRRHLSAPDAEEFASFVHLKLIDKDFAIFRKFEGRSSINTYLAVVIERLGLDFCVAKWGKWRPSAQARRLGTVAILLEQLLVRDGITFDEAVGTLQTNHGVGDTRAELYTLLLQLPIRSPRHTNGDEPNPHVTFAAPRDGARDFDDRHEIERVQAALIEALAVLPPEDREIVALRFERALPVSEIALALGVGGKPLYRRLQQIIRRLRTEMLGRGIDEAAIAQIIGHPTLMLTDVIAGGPHRSRN